MGGTGKDIDLDLRAGVINRLDRPYLPFNRHTIKKVTHFVKSKSLMSTCNKNGKYTVVQRLLVI